MGTLYTPALTINPPPASSTSLFKWEIMQMSSHHRSTPHISDVHSVKSIVRLWEHVWPSAHECLCSVRDGCGLNTQPTSQVFQPHHNISAISHKAAVLYYDLPSFFFSFTSNMFCKFMLTPLKIFLRLAGGSHG